MAGSGHGLTSELFADLDTDFVAAPADCWAEMDRELVRGVAVPGQRLNRFRRDARGGPAPARMEQCNYARGVGNENRDAVGDANGESRPPVSCNVAIRFTVAQPAFPPAGVDNDTSAVNLAKRGESPHRRRQLALHGAPATHHLVDWIRSGKPERPGVAGRGKSADSPFLEIGDDFLGEFRQLSVDGRQRE